MNPDIVGIPAYTAKIATVIGGPHASAIPVETLQEFSDFDIAVVGE
ncbi:MAG: hypothetical protein ACE5J9_06905 [Methanosarcinales archaeon]